MAFVILDNNKFSKVARNEADKNDMNTNPRTGSAVEISDDDFNAYVTNRKEIIVTEGNISYFDGVELFSKDEDELKEKFKNFHWLARLYITKNQGTQLTTQLQNYLGVLSSTDTSSLTYPINWEKHCSDNSITFLHVNQIG